MSKADLKAQILADIAAHVRVYGRASWELVREKPEYAPVIGKEAGEAGRRKFYRWVDVVCEPMGDDLTSPHAGRQENGVALGAAQKRALLAAQKNIPAAPSPAYLMRKGKDADNSINFLAMVERLLADGEKLRATSVKADETAADGEKIANPFMFEKSITARLRVMDTALRVMQEIWDLDYQQRFYDAIVSIIVEELAPYPEAQRRAIERLAELNAKRGMTMHAGLG
jgi:hypothetical protein